MKGKKKRKWTAMASRFFEQAAVVFIVVAGLYLAVLGIASGLVSLFGDVPLMTGGASVTLIGYGAYLVSEVICFMTGSKSLLMAVIDTLVEYINISEG